LTKYKAESGWEVAQGGLRLSPRRIILHLYTRRQPKSGAHAAALD